MFVPMRIAAVLALLLAPALSAGTVEGRVLTGQEPLPGCTITLSAGDVLRTTTSNVNGGYAFKAIPPGRYTLTMELAAFITEIRDINATSDVTTVEDVELRLEPLDEVVTTAGCDGTSYCSSSDPTTPFDRPICAEYELNDTLIESLKHGDASAIGLLQRRYETTFTYYERHRIAGALLGRVMDDREYWKELSGHAANAIRFAYVDGKPSQDFLDWCQARNVDPEDYRWMTILALQTAAGDRRARPLVLAALESSDLDVVDVAIVGVLSQRDESFLPPIEKAIERFPHQAEQLAMRLVLMRSDAADRLAMKFIPEERREAYAEDRRWVDCETMPCDP